MPCFMLDGTPKKDGFIAVRARRHLQRYPKVSRGLAGAVFSRQGAGYPPPLRSPCHRATKPDLTPGFAVLPPHSWGGLGWGGFALRTDWPVAVPKSGKDGFSSDAHQRFKVPGGEIHATKLDLTPGFPPKPDLTPGFAVLPPHSWGGLGWGGFAGLTIPEPPGFRPLVGRVGVGRICPAHRLAGGRSEIRQRRIFIRCSSTVQSAGRGNSCYEARPDPRFPGAWAN